MVCALCIPLTYIPTYTSHFHFRCVTLLVVTLAWAHLFCLYHTLYDQSLQSPTFFQSQTLLSACHDPRSLFHFPGTCTTSTTVPDHANFCCVCRTNQADSTWRAVLMLHPSAIGTIHINNSMAWWKQPRPTGSHPSIPNPLSQVNHSQSRSIQIYNATTKSVCDMCVCVCVFQV